ncbi:MAG: YggT family protein [Alphaproteobacteria bacterium]|nr:YggT family protein [Alphaproteobacteria bacterium]
MNAVLFLIDTVIRIYIWLLIGAAIVSWLVNFDILNPRQRLVATIGEFLYRITEPALRPIRRLLPHLGGIDISPVVLILALLFVQRLLFDLLG